MLHRFFSVTSIFECYIDFWVLHRFLRVTSIFQCYLDFLVLHRFFSVTSIFECYINFSVFHRFFSITSIFECYIEFLVLHRFFSVNRFFSVTLIFLCYINFLSFWERSKASVYWLRGTWGGDIRGPLDHCIPCPSKPYWLPRLISDLHLCIRIYLGSVSLRTARGRQSLRVTFQTSHAQMKK